MLLRPNNHLAILFNLLFTFSGLLYSKIFLIHFSDLNRYIAYTKTNIITNAPKSSIALSKLNKLNRRPYEFAGILNGINATITKYRIFCMVLRPNAQLLIFFKVQNIIRLLVVNFQFFWVRPSDDRGLNSIPLIALNVPRISNLTRAIRINHLRDNV